MMTDAYGSKLETSMDAACSKSAAFCASPVGRREDFALAAM
jgi:hypothetical protein